MTLKHTDAFVIEELEKKAKTISEHVTTNAQIWNRGQHKQSELYSHQRVVLFSDVLALLGERQKELRDKRSTAIDDINHYNEEIARQGIPVGTDECGLRMARASKFAIVEFVKEILGGEE